MGEEHRFYEVLGIANFSSAEEVRIAYKSLALKYHPDKNIGDPTAAGRFRAVSRAYEVLSQVEAKSKYDLALRTALSSCCRHTIPSTSGGNGGSRANPYSTDTTSMADIYTELYQRHLARAKARNHTAAGAPKDASTTASQYSKAQQELFRKKERERQQELCKRRERERREQRNREREALRKEQERQEELLQQQWRRQQATYMARSAMRASAAAAAVGHRSAQRTGSVDGVEETPSTRSRRDLPRIFSAEETRNTGDGVARPEAGSSSTPMRSTTSTRSGLASTPPTRWPRTPVSLTTRPLATRTRGGSSTITATATLSSPSKLVEDGEVEEEEREDLNDHHGGRAGSVSSTLWHTPRSSPASDGEEESRENDALRGSTVAEAAMMRSPGGVRPHCNDGATGSSCESAAATLLSNRLPRCASVKLHCNSSGDDETVVLPDEELGCSRPSSRGASSASRRRRCRGDVRANTFSASGAATPNSRGTPGNNPNARAHTPGAAPLSTASVSPCSQCAAPQGTGQGGASTSPCPTSSTAKPANTSCLWGSSPSRKVTRARGVAVSSCGVTTAANSLNRTGPLSFLAESDRELLDKQRRERMATIQARQRAMRLAEEARRFCKYVRTARQRVCAENSSTTTTAAGASAAAAAEKDDEDDNLTAEELPSLDAQMYYVLQDEASERNQIIEREEMSAWRRLQRQYASTTRAVIVRPLLAALATEEAVQRNCLGEICGASRNCLLFYFDERLDRLYVAALEGRNRRQILGLAATDQYHALRASHRRLSLAAAQERAQRCRLSESSQGSVTGPSSTASEDFERGSPSEAPIPPRHRMLMTGGNDGGDSDATLSHGGATTYAAWLPSRRFPVDGALPTPSCNDKRDAHFAFEEASLPSATLGSSSASITAKALMAGGPTAERGVLETASRGAVDVDIVAQAADNSWDGRVASTRYPDGPPALSQRQKFHAPPSPSADSFTADVDSAATPSGPSTRWRLAALLNEETRLREYWRTQQHEEEVELRRRRAAALHKIFEIEKSDAILRVRRGATAEVRALKARLNAFLGKAEEERRPRSFGGNTSDGGTPYCLQRSPRRTNASPLGCVNAGSLADLMRWSIDSPLASRRASTLLDPLEPGTTTAMRARCVATARPSGGASNEWTTLEYSDVDA